MQIEGHVTTKELVIEPHAATSNDALTITAKPTMTKKAPIPSAKLLGFHIPTVLTLVVRIHLFPQHMPFLDLEVRFHPCLCLIHSRSLPRKRNYHSMLFHPET